ncbi:peptide chain release factor 1 [Oceanicella sp. SM1341]|uniref:peptide chain release factor 1 n=1 Tax=Oceanicella sp. SM1341 TaxID=1548889 RepID=UPI000E507720|nr:peptide chain release factor 1 [Oceanicella sp. SM1341]
MIPKEKLDTISQRFAYLEARLSEALSPADLAALSREYAELKPVAEQIAAYRALLEDEAAARALLNDPEVAGLAREELAAVEARRPELEQAMRVALLPRDIADTRPAILEIRPGTGGDEASLFAVDLLRMYQRFAESQGWSFEILDETDTELGGIREVVAAVRGPGVFARMKYESGVHRVQRVPETESGGRIHTSAATVAVLPEAAETEVEIPAADIRIDTMRASGAGGQHVNTTDSAVRITHIPTGIVVTSSEKSQHQNRARALEVLRARLYDMQRQQAADSRAAERRSQVGSGDRSERIRTYNFPQGRMTDHRINLTLYRLEQIMAGDLGEVVDALVAADQAARLAQLEP